VVIRLHHDRLLLAARAQPQRYRQQNGRGANDSHSFCAAHQFHCHFPLVIIQVALKTQNDFGQNGH
jgi:hypothetical protein